MYFFDKENLKKIAHSLKDKKRMNKKDWYDAVEALHSLSSSSSLTTKEIEYKNEIKKCLLNDINSRENFDFLCSDGKKTTNKDHQFFNNLVSLLNNNFVLLQAISDKPERFKNVAKEIEFEHKEACHLIKTKLYNLIIELNYSKTNEKMSRMFKLFNVHHDLFFDSEKSNSSILELLKNPEVLSSHLNSNHKIFWEDIRDFNNTLNSSGNKSEKGKKTIFFIESPLTRILEKEKSIVSVLANKQEIFSMGEENKTNGLIKYLLENNASLFMKNLNDEKQNLNDFYFSWDDNVLYKPLLKQPIDYLYYERYLELSKFQKDVKVLSEKEFYKKRNENVVFNYLFSFVFDASHPLDAVSNNSKNNSNEESFENLKKFYSEFLLMNSHLKNWLYSFSIETLEKSMEYLNKINKENEKDQIEGLSKEKLSAMHQFLESILLNKLSIKKENNITKQPNKNRF